MPNKNYQKGVRFERSLMKTLKLQGFEVTRASGSHSSYDIIAYRVDQKPLFIQAKVTNDPTLGRRMIKNFKKETVPSNYYHQALYVKAGRGMVHFMEVIV